MNGINEWNPLKLGWLKVGSQGDFIMPSDFILSKYLEINITSCEENQSIGATFHGTLAPRDLNIRGKCYLIG